MVPLATGGAAAIVMVEPIPGGTGDSPVEAELRLPSVIRGCIEYSGGDSVSYSVNVLKNNHVYA